MRKAIATHGHPAVLMQPSGSTKRLLYKCRFPPSNSCDYASRRKKHANTYLILPAMRSNNQLSCLAIVASLVAMKLVMLFWGSVVFHSCPTAVREAESAKFHADIPPM